MSVISLKTKMGTMTADAAYSGPRCQDKSYCKHMAASPPQLRTVKHTPPPPSHHKHANKRHQDGLDIDTLQSLHSAPQVFRITLVILQMEAFAIQTEDLICLESENGVSLCERWIKNRITDKREKKRSQLDVFDLITQMCRKKMLFISEAECSGRVCCGRDSHFLL